MKYIKYFEKFDLDDLTYGDALKMGRFDKEIKKHIEDNYPEHSYTAEPPKNLITFGRSIGAGQAKKLLALAKRKKDTILLDLLNKRTKNIEEVNLDRAVRKYNL